MHVYLVRVPPASGVRLGAHEAKNVCESVDLMWSQSRFRLLLPHLCANILQSGEGNANIWFIMIILAAGGSQQACLRHPDDADGLPPSDFSTTFLPAARPS